MERTFVLPSFLLLLCGNSAPLSSEERDSSLCPLPTLSLESLQMQLLSVYSERGADCITVVSDCRSSAVRLRLEKCRQSYSLLS